MVSWASWWFMPETSGTLISFVVVDAGAVVVRAVTVAPPGRVPAPHPDRHRPITTAVARNFDRGMSEEYPLGPRSFARRSGDARRRVGDGYGGAHGSAQRHGPAGGTARSGVRR